MAIITPIFFTILFFFIISGGIVELAKGQESKQRAWCVAKPSTSDEELQINIDYACGHINCGKIQPGGPCFYPETLINHASVAMNLFYQSNGRETWTCDFKKSGVVSLVDPSYGNCIYEYSQ